MSSRKRKAETRTGDDNESRTELDGETSGRSNGNEIDTDGGNDLVAESGKTGDNTETTQDKDPGGNLGLAGEGVVEVDGKNTGEGSNGVGNIVTTVGEGIEGSSDDLEEGEGSLSLRVELLGVVVDLVDLGLLILKLGVDISAHELERLLGSLLFVLLLALLLGLLGLHFNLDGGRLLLSGVGLLLELVLDLLSQNGDDEEEENETDDDTDADSPDNTLPERHVLSGGEALVENVEDVDGEGDSGHDGEEDEGTSEAVLVSENEGTDDPVEEGGNETSEDGGSEPGDDDFDDLAPLNAVGTSSNNTAADETTNDGVGGGDGKTVDGGKKKPDSGREKSTDVGPHQVLGVLGKDGGVDDALGDGISDVGAQEIGTTEFHDGSDDKSHVQGDGLGTDRGSEGVGDIVGT